MNLRRMDSRDQCYYAEMRDYSRGGLSMMTKEKLVIGQSVYLELQNNKESTLDMNVDYSGVVRWAKAHSSTNGGANGLFKYGIAFSGTT